MHLITQTVFLLTICISSLISLSQADQMYSSSDVVDLTPDNFDRRVINSDDVWVVEFYAPWCGHCQRLVPDYKKVAKGLKGVVKVGAVNADEHKSLGQQYGVRGFPTIKIFGENKNKPEDYSGDRTADKIVDAALSAVRRKVNSQLGRKGSSSGGSSGDSGKKDVVELTDSNFNDLVLNSKDLWLVEFFAPWCGHCKNLAPEWAKAATELRGKVKLGALDATAHQSKAAEFEVKGYPTIKFFRPGSRSSNDAEEYNGGRTASDIVAWALEKLAESQPAPEVREFINEEVFKDTCEGRQLCIISFLPNILDCQSDCRNNYIKTLKKVAERFKKNLWGWLWAEATAQQDFESALQLEGLGYPTLAAVNPKRGFFSPLRGAFSEDGISDFLKQVLYGGSGITTVKISDSGLPKVKTVEPWDGKDGQPPVEEEIDLSDVDLKDEL